MHVSSTGHMSRRPSLHNPIPPSPAPELYSDSRFHGPQGPNRQIRMPRATAYGGGAIAKSEDGLRCVIAGRESLRILRMSDPGAVTSADHKAVVNRGGYRIDASRNLWTGSGLKIDSASTDVAWGHGTFNNKILTSARNGELMMWDLNKSGPSKFERRIRQHVRSIHKLAYSTVLQYYCITGSADGDIRVWDLRDLSNSIMKIHHPTSVRAVVFSPVPWQPRHCITGLDNGNIYRWDLNMGQRGQLDRISLAHAGPILALDWSLPSIFSSNANSRNGNSAPSSQGSNWYAGVGSGLFDDLGSNTNTSGDGDGTGMGWLASGGMDRCVKVWNLTAASGEAHISRQPVYTLHTAFPVRRVLWRPNYDCELAVVSNLDFGTGSQSTHPIESATGTPATSPRLGHTAPVESLASEEDKVVQMNNAVGDPIEVWDVRRGYVAKWSLRGSAVEGGVTDVEFKDSHTLWAQHFSGAFSQLDLRYSSRPLDAVPRSAVTWDPTGSLTFVAGRSKRWEIPYDDTNPDKNASSKRKVKTLGDKLFAPSSQCMGMVTGHGLVEDAVTFMKLAQGYTFDGPDKPTICSRNAQIAKAAGKHDAVQVWMLLANLLTDVAPTEAPTPAITLSPLPLVSPRLPHSTSAPAAIPTLAHPLPTSNTLIHSVRSLSEDAHGPTNGRESPGAKSNGSGPSLRRDEKGRTHSSASLSISSSGTGYLSPLRTTPASSTTTSPRRPTSPLPALSTSVTPSALGRRSSGGSGPLSLGGPPTSMRPRLGSSFRRPSFSTLNSATTSLRHVGEGALDDSDSEGSSEEKMHLRDDPGDYHTEMPDPNDDEPDAYTKEDPTTVGVRASSSSSYRPTISPYLYPRSTSVQPSPLSQVAGKQTWTEDEKEEEDSPSPASTDSESSFNDGDIQPQHFFSRHAGSSKSKSRRSSLKSGKTKARSRSSTVASLSVSVAASSASSRGRLIKQESQSSIKTVTASATPTSLHGPDKDQDYINGLAREETLRDPNNSGVYAGPGTFAGSRGSLRSSSFYSQNRALSEDPFLERAATEDRMTRTSRTQAIERETMKRSEARFREAGWAAMRETLEVYADEGDVQMCAMLSLVAPAELKVSNSRVLRFVDGYVDILMRMRLHTSAAYMRKYAPLEEVRNRTNLETTIYTCCGRCRKPFLHPVARQSSAGKPSGSYAFCTTCNASSTKCAICHLPVRALFFKCPVCQHGGHQECYQQYYLRRPLLVLPSSLANPAPGPDSHHHAHSVPETRDRGRAASAARTADGSGSEDGLSSRDGEDGRYRVQDASGGDGKHSIFGHPCAAGCGHHCWAANEALLYSGAEPEVRFSRP